MKINLRTVLFLAGVLLIVSNPCSLAHTDVTAEQARDLVDSTNDLIVVDVREPYEYRDARGHIPGALNYPWSSGVLRARYEELPTDGPVLVVCRSGGRSNAAASFLDSNGFSTVYDMLGGMSAWQWETTPCKYSGGSGTADDPYQIATAGGLIALGESPEDYDKHFILTADIDLDPDLPGRKVFDRAVIAPDTDWLTWDFQGSPFTGVFDGNGHTISRLSIKGRTGHLGLFGQSADGANILNLRMEAVDVSGNWLVGGLVGQNYGSITTCCSNGTINGYLYSGGGDYTGGLVGFNNGSITTSYSNCTVNGMVNGKPAGGSMWANREVGGLVGENWGHITTSYSTATVSGGKYVGTLVGYNGGFTGGITMSYSNGTVSGSSKCGGLVGGNAGSISTSYSTGTVTGYTDVGGLVGSNSGDITKSCSTGSVSGDSQAGGLVGENWGGNVNSSLWDMETSDQTTSYGGTGKTTAEMQTTSTFLDAGWDFVDETANGTDDIWWILEGQDYPRLWWETQN